MRSAARGETSPWLIVAIGLVLLVATTVIVVWMYLGARDSPADVMQTATGDQIPDVLRIVGVSQMPDDVIPLIGPSEAQPLSATFPPAALVERAGFRDEERLLVVARYGRSQFARYVAGMPMQQELNDGMLDLWLEGLVVDLDDPRFEEHFRGAAIPVLVTYPGSLEVDGVKYEGAFALTVTDCPEDRMPMLAFYHRAGQPLDDGNKVMQALSFAKPCL